MRELWVFTRGGSLPPAVSHHWAELSKLRRGKARTDRRESTDDSRARALMIICRCGLVSGLLVAVWRPSPAKEAEPPPTPLIGQCLAVPPCSAAGQSGYSTRSYAYGFLPSSKETAAVVTELRARSQPSHTPIHRKQHFASGQFESTNFRRYWAFFRRNTQPANRSRPHRSISSCLAAMIPA